MEIKTTLVFDIWGDYAHFKKIYVTTSALTYSLPFKTTIYGLVGAIIGLDNKKNGYLDHFNEENCQLAIQVINPVKIQRININFSPKPGPIKDNRKPTTMEYLVKPRFRIFFSHKDEQIYNSLKENLEEKRTVYTPVLGLAHCIANFEFLGEYELTRGSGNAMIDSILLKSLVKSLDTSSWNENDVRVQEQTMYPLEMNTTREVTKRDNVLFDLNGNPIQAEVEHYFNLNLDGKKVNIMMM